MAWRLDGRYFENCSCEVPCPCTVSLMLPADNERCHVMLVFRVDSGEVDGTDVSGLTVAMVVDAPQLMGEGDWRVGLVIDEAASDEQAAKLGSVFSGDLGGPPSALAPLIGEMLGVERAPIEFSSEGLVHSVRIGDATEVEVEDVVPFGKEDGQPARLEGIFHPAGTALTIAKARKSRISAVGLDFANEGKSAFSSQDFSWAA